MRCCTFPLLAALSIMALAPSAQAGFSIVKPTPAPAPVQASPLVAVHYLGVPPTTIPVRAGFGRDIPLADALKQIAPSGWHARLKPDMVNHFDRAKPVTWRGGGAWTSVLDSLAVDAGFSVDVDWAQRLLLVGAPKAQPAFISTPVETRQWTAERGHMLRASLLDWAKTAGWELRWVAPIDYPLQVPLSATGSFSDAVTAALRPYEKAKRPLRADTCAAQKLIVVDEIDKAAPPCHADTRAHGDAVPSPRILAETTGYTLRAGQKLSQALADYVKRYGWQIRWQIGEDYVLDVDVPLPAMKVEEGVTYVVRAYQSQGGLAGVEPRFAAPNRVVVIEPMDVHPSPKAP